MPKLTLMDNIISSGKMKISHRILTTDLQWPNGDPPFAAGEYVKTTYDIDWLKHDSVIQLPASHFIGNDTGDYLKLQTIDGVTVGQDISNIEKSWIVNGADIIDDIPANAVIESIQIVSYSKAVGLAVFHSIYNLDPLHPYYSVDDMVTVTNDYALNAGTVYTVNPITEEPWTIATATAAAFGVSRYPGSGQDVYVDKIYKVINYYTIETPIYNPATFDAAAWTDCTALINDYHVTQDSAMQIDAASLSVALAWKSSLAQVFREMRAVVIQEKYSDGTNTTGWSNVFWGISDGYTEKWTGSQHGYVVNCKDILKLANIETLAARDVSIVYEPDAITIGTYDTHYQLTLVNTDSTVYEYGITAIAGDATSAVHPNWSDKPAPQFWCNNARDKDNVTCAAPVPLSVDLNNINAVFGEGILRLLKVYANGSSASGDLTDYSAGLNVSGNPDIRCVLKRYAHPECEEAVAFRSHKILDSDIYDDLTVVDNGWRLGAVEVNTPVNNRDGLTLILNDGSGRRYLTTGNVANTTTILFSNASIETPAIGTKVTLGEANRVTSVITRMLLNSGFQTANAAKPFYINPPEIPQIAGETRDIVLPPLVYKDEDKIYPMDAIEALRRSGYIPPNYYVRATDEGQIESSSVAILPDANAGIISTLPVTSSPGIEYDRNDIEIKTRVISRGVSRIITDYAQLAGTTITDWTGDNCLPSPAFAFGTHNISGSDAYIGQYYYNGYRAVRSGASGENYLFDLSNIFAQGSNTSNAGKSQRPWGWYYNFHVNNLGYTLPDYINPIYAQWTNKILCEIVFPQAIIINNLEIHTPNSWWTDTTDWGTTYHSNGAVSETNLAFTKYFDIMESRQIIRFEYYDAEQTTWKLLTNDIVCEITMDPAQYIKQLGENDFVTRAKISTTKIRLVCVSPWSNIFGYDICSMVFGIYLSRLKIWGSQELRGYAELGNAENYNSELVLDPWPSIKKRLRTRTHIMPEAIPWINNTTDADWMALEWLKQLTSDLAPRKLSVIRPDLRLWDTVTIKTPGGDDINYLVTSADHGADGQTSITAVSYTLPYFEE